MKYSIDCLLPIISTKWRLRKRGRERVKMEEERIQVLTAPVNISYISVPRLHQSTALP